MTNDPRVDEASLTEAAVEAAAMVHCNRGDSDWRDWTEDAKAEARQDMRAALEAAHPVLLAELRKAREALARVEALAAAWTARGEHDMAFSKTVPDEDIAMALLTEGASMVENARHIRAAVAAAKGDDRG